MKIREPVAEQVARLRQVGEEVRQVLFLVEGGNDEEELWPAFGLSPLVHRSS